MLIAAVALALLLLPGAVPAAAQSASAAATPVAAATGDAGPSAATCEIHAWSTARVRSVSEGGVWNETVGQRQRTDPRWQLRALDPAQQVAYLKGLPWASLLNRPGAAVIVHDQPIEPRAVRASRARQSASTAPCYHELMVMDVQVQTAPLTGEALALTVTHRRFDAGAAEATGVFTNILTEELSQFPAKEPSGQAAADAELAAAYREILIRFVANEARQQSKVDGGTK